MNDPPSYPDPGDDTDVGADGRSTAGTPRWVKVFGLIALVVILLFVVSLLTGRGGHGPGRHTAADRPGGHRPPAAVAEPGGHKAPVQQP